MHCRGCLEKQLRIDKLEADNERLRGKLRNEERSGREEPFGSSTPSSRKQFKPNSDAGQQERKGGARPGHKGHGRESVDPEDADEVQDVSLEAEFCPDCRGDFENAGYRKRTVVDLAEVRPQRILLHLQKCRCRKCGRTFQAKPPGVLPKNLYSNRLLVEVAVDHFLHGIPMGRIAARLNLPIGPLLHSMHVLARVFAKLTAWLIAQYRREGVRHADETGWRNDGQSGFVWVFCTPNLVLFLFCKTRSAAVPREVFGKNRLKGVLVVDRYGAYNRLQCRIQYCYAHILRDVEDLEKEFPDDEEIAAFVSTLAPLLSEACHLRGQKISDARYYRRARELRSAIIAVVEKQAHHPGIQKIQDIFREHRKRMFHWATDRRVPAENNRAERALRPTVIARKVSHGSQSEEGAKTRGVLMSALHTCKARGLDPRRQMLNALDAVAADPKKNAVRILLGLDTT